MRASRHGRRDIGADPQNRRGGATWGPDSGQRGAVVPGTADKDDAMLVDDLVGELDEAADVGRACGLPITG